MVLHNPNNWHWVDKNCIYWSRDYFTEKAVGIKGTSDDGLTNVEISELKSLEGDVDVCQRKGKVISLFDLKMEFSYKGAIESKDKDDVEAIQVTGKINVPELAYDSEPDDLQFSITIDQEESKKEPAKVVVRQKLVPQLRKILGQFGTDLITTHGKDIQHQGVKNPLKEADDLSQSAQKQQGSNQQDTSSSEKKIVGTAAYNTTSLHLEPSFNAPASMLYDAFLKPEMVAAWTRAKPDIQAKEGSDYSLFAGNISGKLNKLVPGESISMTWRLRDWKPEHYADLSLQFVQSSGETVLKVDFKGVPIGQEEVVQNNFEEYYVKSIKVTFGFGAIL